MTDGPHLSAKDAAIYAFAKCDRLEAFNTDLLTALKRATKAIDIAINLTPTGPARNRLCDMNIEAHALIAKACPQAGSAYLNRPLRSLEQAVRDAEGKS